MKKRKKLIIISAVILIIIILLIALRPKQSIYEFTTVERKDIKQMVSASGTIKPSQEINLQFETTGKVRNIFVKVGDQVKAGRILVKLNDSDLQAQYQQQQAAVNAAKAQLALLKAGSSQEEINLAENTAANALESLANVKNKADNDLNVLYEQSKEIMNNAYLKADAMYNKQVSDLFDSYHRLTFSTTASQAQIIVENQHADIKEMISQLNNYLLEISSSTTDERLDNISSIFKTDLQKMRSFLDSLAEALNSSVGIASATLTTYKLNLDTARTNINTVISSILGDQQNIASQKIINQTNINTAQSSLDQANDQLAIKKVGPRIENINYQEALVNQQEASLAGSGEKIRKTNLIAPIDGIITNVGVEVGETVSVSQAPILMNSLGNFEIELDIPETDIIKIITSQIAEISLDAFPNEKFLGHVIKINPAETIIQGVVYYKSTISFDQQDSRVRAGMTANVDIVTAEKQMVLTTPLRAVIEKNGLKHVRILVNNIVQEKEIKTGLVSTQSEVEIISGLAENEEIISFVKTK